MDCCMKTRIDYNLSIQTLVIECNTTKRFNYSLYIMILKISEYNNKTDNLSL